MGDGPRAELFYSLHSLYQTREYADLVIHARDGSRHPVHKAIVCPRSDYFSNAVREGRWKDGQEGHIALPDDDPEAVRLLVEYFYLLDYDPIGAQDDPTRTDRSDTLSIRTDAGNYGELYGTSAISAFGGPDLLVVNRTRPTSSLTPHALPTAEFNVFLGPSQRRNPRRSTSVTAPQPSPLATAAPNLVLHAKMYAGGQKYGVAGLKTLALDKFKLQLTRHWDAGEFAPAIQLVYRSTPASDKDMREAVINTLDWHSGLLDKPDIEAAVMEINGLAYELLKRSRRAEPEYSD